MIVKCFEGLETNKSKNNQSKEYCKAISPKVVHLTIAPFGGQGGRDLPFEERISMNGLYIETTI